MKLTRQFALPTGKDTSRKPQALRILHVAECYEAGVGHAIDTIVRIRDEDTHILLYSGDRDPSEHFSHAQQLPHNFLRRILHVRAAVRTYSPDIIHLHSSWAGVYGRTALLRSPIVYQPHCFKFDDPSLSNLKRHLFRIAEKCLGRLTTVVLALSAQESRLAQQISPSATCVMLPNAPTLESFPGKRPHHVISTEGDASPKKVVMVGRISPQKDPMFFIAIAETVRKSLPQAEFVWVGDGDEHLKKRLRDANVTVTGWLDSSALIDVLDASTCYVHTASYEGFPLSVLDAAARQMPIVARRIPAFDGTGLLQGSTSESVAEQVLRVLSDAQVSSDATQRGQQVLEVMNDDKQGQALGQAYMIALGDKR